MYFLFISMQVEGTIKAHSPTSMSYLAQAQAPFLNLVYYLRVTHAGRDRHASK